MNDENQENLKELFEKFLDTKQAESFVEDVQKKQIESRITEPKQSDNEQIDKLQIQLTRLNTDTRELIMLRFYSELSFKEIALMRSEPIGTTLAKLHRGLKKLRELMK